MELSHGQVPHQSTMFPVFMFIHEANGFWDWIQIGSGFLQQFATDMLLSTSPDPLSRFAIFPCGSLTFDVYFSQVIPIICCCINIPANFKKAGHGTILNPHRIRAFLWNKNLILLTNVERLVEGMNTDNLCSRCNTCPNLLCTY